MSIFSRDSKRTELRRIPLFAALPRRRFDLLTRAADVVEVPAEVELIREGGSGHEFFAISEGEVEISQGGTPIATEQAGDVFGEIALLHGVPRTATVRTTAPSRLFVLDARSFRSVLVDSFAPRQPVGSREDDVHAGAAVGAARSGRPAAVKDGAFEVAVTAPTVQLLTWLAESPRSYPETLEAWKTSCPRLAVWEDALADGLVRIDRGCVGLTPAGRKLLPTVGTDRRRGD